MPAHNDSRLYSQRVGEALLRSAEIHATQTRLANLRDITADLDRHGQSTLEHFHGGHLVFAGTTASCYRRSARECPRSNRNSPPCSTDWKSD